MNNGFEKDGQNGFDTMNNGGADRNGTSDYSANNMTYGMDDMSDNIGNTEDLSKVDPAAPRNGATGEYHYRGNQMGGYGTERFSGRPEGMRDYGYSERDGYNARREHYNDDGMRTPGYGRGYENDMYAQRQTGYEPPKPSKKREGARKGITVLIVALVCMGTVLLSAAAGFGGALVYNRYAGGKGGAGKGGSTVIDRVVESDTTTSTGEKGVYTEVAAAVKDSVVEITTEFKVTGFFQYISEGAGSGVIISEDGYIITNNHVISDTSKGTVADSITVRLTDGTEYKAELVGRDADSDIAVIKVEAEEKLDHAVFGDSDKLVVGEEVVAVGNPLGELGGTVTNGIISALDREISVDGTKMNLLQTNAAINPGNSGGGLFNMKGELVGVVNAKSSGSGIEGLGFAIPANDAREVATQLIEHGYVTGKVFLGITFVDVDDPYTAYRYFKSQATGVYVMELAEGYNDDVLKVGDRIIAMDENEITAFSQIKDLLKDHKVGDTIEFTLYREGKLKTVEVKCHEYVPDESESVDFGEDK